MRHVVTFIALAVLLGSCSDDDAADSPTSTTTTTVAEPPLIDLGGPLDGAPLPDTFPNIGVADGTGVTQPGWTLFNLRRFGEEGTEPLSYVAMTNDAGVVVWSIENDGFAGETILTEAGTVMFIFNDHTIREVDTEGRIIRELVSEAAPDRGEVPHPVVAVDVETFHHEITELPDGNLLVLASESMVFESGQPLCGEDPATFDGTYKVIGDEVVEIVPDTGAVVGRRSLFDVFDPLTTQGTDFCTFASPFGPYPDDPEANDWSHANAASLSPAGEIIVSIRHLDTIIAWPLDDPDADPTWVFGPGGTVTAAPGDEFLHQHAPEVQDDGTILVYDNGNDRPGPDGEPIDQLFSRVVGYEIDPAGEAELVWEYRRDSRGIPVYAQAVGDVDRLDNGNTLIVDGFIDFDRAEIVEIDGADQVVRIMTVEAEDARWLVYRAERIEAPF